MKSGLSSLGASLAPCYAAAISIVTCSTCPPPIGGSRPSSRYEATVSWAASRSSSCASSRVRAPLLDRRPFGELCRRPPVLVWGEDCSQGHRFTRVALALRAQLRLGPSRQARADDEPAPTSGPLQFALPSGGNRSSRCSDRLTRSPVSSGRLCVRIRLSRLLRASGATRRLGQSRSSGIPLPPESVRSRARRARTLRGSVEDFQRAGDALTSTG